MGFVKYDGQQWTKDNSSLMALYYLGVASEHLTPFERLPNSTKIVTIPFNILSSISPNDPNFKLEIKPEDTVPSVDDD